MTPSRSLFLQCLREPKVWAGALLATVPPDALASWQGWDLVDPGYLGSMLIWWPIDTFVRLAVLAWLLKKLQGGRPAQGPWSALGPAIQAEALLSFRCGIVALLGLLPALIVLALFGVEYARFQILVLGLAGLGLMPAVGYFMRRSLFPVALLVRPLRSAEALDWSQARLAKKLRAFMRLALPWWALGLVLDALSLGLGTMGFGGQCLAWTFSVPSLCASLLPLAVFCADADVA